METPCPPYYAEPTHEQTLLFSTTSYVRNYNDWYQCIEGAYCNAPSFLGYNPPGQGNLWQEAWEKLDEEYACNPTLETSSSGASKWNGGMSDQELVEGPDDAFERTNRPTNKPTKPGDLPSLISGVVWYDSNGDGRKNTLGNALSQSDYSAAGKERGAGLSNMKITLRECQSDELLGITYTFPRSFGLGGEGVVEVIDASYLESIQSQEQESIGFNFIGNDGLGIGNTQNELGYYSFRIIPVQLPGKFYVVFESPENYRLTGGSGDYWEVYKAAMYDTVQPLREATWLTDNAEDPSNRHLQNNATMSNNENNATAILQTSESLFQSNPQTTNPAERPKSPINHSGYYARSNCISIQKSPTQITNIDAGLTEDSWPLVPYQYASLIVTIKFYAAGGGGGGSTRRNRRKLQVNDSLECRKYQKLKSEGVEVDDIWGCEQAAQSGNGAVQMDLQELTLEEGNRVTSSLKDFLDSRISRVWTVKLVALTHQELTMLVGDDQGNDNRRRLGASSSPPPHHHQHMTTTKHSRGLQGNKEIANLELGFRIRAEYSTDKTSSIDLTEVLSSSLRNGGDAFLMGLKGTMPTYFKPAGSVEVRDVVWQPEDDVKEEDMEDEDVGVDDVKDPSQQLENVDVKNGMSTGLLIGIIFGSFAFVGIIIGLLIYCRRKKKGTDNSSEENSQSLKKKSSFYNNRWSQWQHKKAGMEGTTKIKTKKTVDKASRDRNVSEHSSSGFDNSSGNDDDDNDLSSQFYSDSSNFDPETRRTEVGGYGDDDGSDGYDDDDDDLSSRFYSDSSNFDPEARAREVGGYGDGGSVYSNETGSQSYNSEGGGDDSSYNNSYETGSRRSYASGSIVSQNPRSSVRSGATSGSESRRSQKSNNNPRSSMRSSAISGRTNQSSMRSSGSRTNHSSMRSSGSRTNQSSMRSSGSSRRTDKSSMRSSGRTSNRTSGTSMRSSSDLYGSSGRRWGGSQGTSSASKDYYSATSRGDEDDHHSQTTRGSSSTRASRKSSEGRSRSSSRRSQS